jgi:hypothetical protein
MFVEPPAWPLQDHLAIGWVAFAAAARFLRDQFFVLFMIEINPPPGRLLALHPQNG